VSGSLVFEKNGAVATIRIDRPEKLNTVTPEMGREFSRIADEVNADDAVRAVLLLGTGDRAFSAGSDVGVLDEYGTNWQLRNRIDYAKAVLAIRKPVVAGIRGYAIGGGLELALASDVRYATPDARFGAGEIKLGWCGGAGETQLLPRIVGAGNALEMLLTGDMISAERALQIGLVQRIVPAEELDGAVADLAERIAANAPIAVQIVKHLVRVAQSTSLDVGLSYENDLFAYCFTTSDSDEGRAAFAAKRPPRFRGE
jgi:enoyl-CoA hydratase/carnithine racemase